VESSFGAGAKHHERECNWQTTQRKRIRAAQLYPFTLQENRERIEKGECAQAGWKDEQHARRESDPFAKSACDAAIQPGIRRGLLEG
jgi:hypothetical protein